MGLPADVLEKLQGAGGDPEEIKAIGQEYLDRALKLEQLEARKERGQLQRELNAKQRELDGAKRSIEDAAKELESIDTPDGLAAFLRRSGATEEEIAGAVSGDVEAANRAMERIALASGGGDTVSELGSFTQKIDPVAAEVAALKESSAVPPPEPTVEHDVAAGVVTVTLVLASTVRSVADVDLDVDSTSLRLSGGGTAPLEVALPVPCDEHAARAKFARRASTLRVTIPTRARDHSL